MALWDDFLHGVLPYQEYWLPLGIGLVSGMVCVFAGSLVWRGRKSSADKKIQVGPEHDPFNDGSLMEKRRSLRRSGNPVQILYARPENRNVASQALILDRSLGGLRIGVGEAVEPGARLLVLPMNASEQIPWIEVDVHSCRPIDDSWELHCQFLKTPQWSILLLFG